MFFEIASEFDTDGVWVSPFIDACIDEFSDLVEYNMDGGVIDFAIEFFWELFIFGSGFTPDDAMGEGFAVVGKLFFDFACAEVGVVVVPCTCACFAVDASFFEVWEDFSDGFF